jgi:hypothetical protein
MAQILFIGCLGDFADGTDLLNRFWLKPEDWILLFRWVKTHLY